MPRFRKSSITFVTTSVAPGLTIAVRGTVKGEYATHRIMDPQRAVDLATSLLRWAADVRDDRRRTRQARRMS